LLEGDREASKAWAWRCGKSLATTQDYGFLAGAVFAATGFAQSGGTWQEQWFNAEYGRYSRTVEARRGALTAKALERNTVKVPAHAKSSESAPFADRWREHRIKAKFGR